MIKKLCAKLGWYKFSVDEIVLIRMLATENKRKHLRQYYAEQSAWNRKQLTKAQDLYWNLDDIYPFIQP